MADRVLRLEGEVDGRVIAHRLDIGRHTIGSDSDNDLVVPAAGVSRHHAAVRVDADAVTVEDLESKNGTWVDGRRVEHAPIRTGGVLHLGRVALVLGEVAPGDADLAVDLSGESSSNWARAGETGTQSGSTDPAGRTTLLRSALNRLFPPSPGHVERCLDVVRAELEATWVALLSTHDDVEPVVIAAVGDIGETESVPLPARLDRTRAGADTAWATRRDSDRIHALVARLPAGVPDGTLDVLDGLLPALLAIAGAPPISGDAASPREWSLVLPPGYVVGPSKAVADLHEQLRLVVAGDDPVLVTGETGVGKEMVPRILHASSPRRREARLVALNCAAIPGDLLEAELFGIREGVATGVAARTGTMQLADGGVLFLDEIGELPPSLQAKLLRALEEREVQALGARAPTPVDVRLISATNTDLEARIADGRFRADLYYRIAGVQIDVPPLRERREDIPALVAHFVARFADEAGRRIRGVSVDAMAALQAAPWPGNVRELQNQLRRLVHACPHGGVIESTMLPASLALGAHHPADRLDLHARMLELERELIGDALRRAAGNRSEAARILGLSRNGLAAKMRRLGIE